VVLVRYFAGARAAAGVAEEKVSAATVAELLASVAAAHGERLTAVLPACTLLVDGLACRDHSAALPVAAVVDVLPPFAGG
jgi:molybdopterin synthase sulfur carrier subunit